MQPPDPGMGDVRLAVDSSSAHAISALIYGTNERDLGGAGANLTLGRLGGNRWTAYNWENNASNAGTDWMNQNDAYLGGGDTPGEAVRSAVAAAHAAGAAMIVTVPIIDHVAADTGPGGDVSGSANYLQTRFRRNAPTKGAAFANPPDVRDATVYQDEFVAFLDQAFPGARADRQRTILYSLDNEPDLWSGTHPRVHPEPVTYAELVDRGTRYASAIKGVVPEAVVLGPVSYGWAGFVNLQGARDAGGRDFLEFYLDAMRQAEGTAGRRLVDVLDLHWYPEARGGGVRITGQETGADVARARVQAPRSLWDAAYVEDSWITRDALGGQPIRLLPRAAEKIAAHYPGTLLSLSEYSYGGGGHISGALAQADALGVFGREGLFAATLWPLADDQSFVHAAFAMFRSYDGQRGAFGDVSIGATTSDAEKSSVYASTFAAMPGRVVVVAINKTGTPLTAALSVAHQTLPSRGKAFVLTSAGAAPRAAADLAASAPGAFTYTMPAMSVSTLVLE